jgi:hypothetical protein
MVKIQDVPFFLSPAALLQINGACLAPVMNKYEKPNRALFGAKTKTSTSMIVAYHYDW